MTACPDKIADKPALLAGLLMQRDAEIRELRAELSNIANAKRFNRDYFDDDTAFADWAQSRARFRLAKHTEISHDF